MFWLCYRVNRNQSIARTVKGMTTDINRFLKKDRNNGSYPRSSLQCSCSLPPCQTRAVRGPLGQESLLHGILPAQSHQIHKLQPLSHTLEDFWVKEPPDRAGKLKLKHGANRSTLKEIEASLVNLLRNQGGLVEVFCSPQNNWNELNQAWNQESTFHHHSGSEKGQRTCLFK